MTDRLLTAVLVRLAPIDEPCQMCGWVEPVEVFRWQDTDGHQYSLLRDEDGEWMRIPDDQRGEVVGTW